MAAAGRAANIADELSNDAEFTVKLPDADPIELRCADGVVAEAVPLRDLVSAVLDVECPPVPDDELDVFEE